MSLLQRFADLRARRVLLEIQAEEIHDAVGRVAADRAIEIGVRSLGAERHVGHREMAR